MKGLSLPWNFPAVHRDSMSEVDEAGLLDRARKGDERAFAELFERYQRAVYRYAVHMCGREAADDIVQETFLAVVRQRGRVDLPRGPVGGYLLGIARHRVWKRLSSMPPPAEPLDEAEADTGVVADDVSALEAMTRAEAVAAVRAAIQELPTVYREVVVLCELEELNYAAAAEAIGCPIGTVRSRLHRARALLVTRLKTAVDVVGKT